VLPHLPANPHFILSLTLESERYNFYVSLFNKAHLSIDDTERISGLALQIGKVISDMLFKLQPSKQVNILKKNKIGFIAHSV
jgi:hypothetical protein